MTSLPPPRSATSASSSTPPSLSSLMRTTPTTSPKRPSFISGTLLASGPPCPLSPLKSSSTPSSHPDSTTATASSTAPPTKSSINYNMTKLCRPTAHLHPTSRTHHPGPTPPPLAPGQVQDGLQTTTHHLQSPKQPGPSLSFRPPPPPWPTRCLRSAGTNTLKIIRTKHRTWGDRAFSAAAPALWNALPIHIRQSPTLPSFKQALKTHLFKLFHLLNPLNLPSDMSHSFSTLLSFLSLLPTIFCLFVCPVLSFHFHFVPFVTVSFPQCKASLYI